MAGEQQWQVGDPAPRPPDPRSESDIVAGWRTEEPVVSVCCSTYQHRDFIEDALRGFLAQRTSFPFEVIVRDDASTDGTAEIVADYAQRYPSIIRATLEPVNTWKQPGRKRLRELARGHFIALCEGDDYWLDEQKLQVQVGSLRSQPDAVLSHHQSMVIEDGLITDLEHLPVSHRRPVTGHDLRRGAWTLTNTMCFRNVDLPSHPRHQFIINGDDFLRASLGVFGGGTYEHCLAPSVYRRHAGGVYSMQDPDLRAIRHAESSYWIGKHFVADGDQATGAFYLARSARLLLESEPKLDHDIGRYLAKKYLPRVSQRWRRRVVRFIDDRWPRALSRLRSTKTRVREWVQHYRSTHRRGRALPPQRFLGRGR